ncbi:MAG: type I-A CRISPR-associated protein Cas7/Csa2 [Candidatus Brockarchaeota archaeon]|nr:type I-A CRISPR-associated protein Cas7/Csa2 [Candidatus Brockarchaeota archaeon]MBO3808975.1 type I-A CRISPR-associated protein Cas7/Csa2 [Candidatus Brockarchaeota archaeon]
MFLSLASRFVANIEALNAVESIGNVTKHRRAPVVIFDEKDNRYTIKYVPAISGESIGHAYQANVVEFAKAIYGGSPPVCKWCARGEFLKEMRMEYTIEEAKKVINEKNLSDEDKKHEFEKAVIRNCLVEDIGGFLSAEEFPVKRTSAFQVGYLVPTRDSISATVIDTQFHVRHAPVIAGGETGEETQEGRKKVAAQMLYYVEVASALYGIHFNLDIDAIGKTRLVKVEEAVNSEDKKKRILAAIGGLALTVLGQFGAKKSRFNPISEIKSLTISLCDNFMFSVTPPHDTKYLISTMERAKSFSNLLKSAGVDSEISIYAYDVEKSEKVEGVKYFNTPEGLFETVMKQLKEKGYV